MVPPRSEPRAAALAAQGRHPFETHERARNADTSARPRGSSSRRSTADFCAPQQRPRVRRDEATESRRASALLYAAARPLLRPCHWSPARILARAAPVLVQNYVPRRRSPPARPFLRLVSVADQFIHPARRHVRTLTPPITGETHDKRRLHTGHVSHLEPGPCFADRGRGVSCRDDLGQAYEAACASQRLHAVQVLFDTYAPALQADGLCSDRITFEFLLRAKAPAAMLEVKQTEFAGKWLFHPRRGWKEIEATAAGGRSFSPASTADPVGGLMPCPPAPRRPGPIV